MTAFVIRGRAGQALVIVMENDRQVATDLAHACMYGLIVRGCAEGQLTMTEEDLVIKLEADLVAGDVRGFRREGER